MNTTETPKPAPWWTAIRLLIFTLLGAPLGAFGLSTGLYLANFTDRLAPFYRGGAIGGFSGCAAYAILSLWDSKRSIARRWFGLPPIIGTVVLWVVLMRDIPDMTGAETATVCVGWFVVTAVITAVTVRAQATPDDGNKPVA